MVATMDKQARKFAEGRGSVRYNADRLYCGIRAFGKGEGKGRSDKPAEPVVLIDYSANGLGIITPFAVDRGQQITIDLVGHGKSVRGLRATVRNVQTVSPHLHRLGVQIYWDRDENALWRPVYDEIYELASLHGESAAIW